MYADFQLRDNQIEKENALTTENTEGTENKQEEIKKQ